MPPPPGTMPPPPPGTFQPIMTREEEMNSLTDAFLNGTITRDQLKMLDLKKIRFANRITLMEVRQLLTRDVIDALCMRVFSIGDLGFLDVLVTATYPCLDVIKRNSDIEMDGAMAKEMLDQMRDEKPPNQWDRSDIKTALSMADQLPPGDLRDFDANAMKEAIQGGDFNDMMPFERPDQKRAMKEKIVEAFGNPDTWDKDAIVQLGASGMMNNMDRAKLKDMDPTALGAALADSPASFANMTFDNEAMRMQMGAKLIEAKGGRNQADSWNAEDIKGMGQFIKSRPSIVKSLDATELLAALPDLALESVDRNKAPAMARKLKQTGKFATPGSLTGSDIEEMGDYIKGTGKSFLDQLPAAEIANAKATFAAMELRPEDSKVVLKKLNDAGEFNLNSLTAANFPDIQMMANGLDSDAHIENIPDADVVTMIDQGVGALDLKRPQIRKILKKAKAGNGGSLGDKAQKLYMMMEHLPRSDLEQLSYDDLGFDCVETEPVEMMFDEGQARMMFDKIRSNMGDVSNGTNYLPGCFQRWGAVAAVGMDKSDIEDLAEDENLASVVERLSENKDYMDDAKVKAVAEKVKAKFALATDAGAEAITEAEIEQVGAFLGSLSDTDLNRFPDAMKPVVARKMGEMSSVKVSKKELKRRAKFALRNVLRDDTDTVTDRSGSSTLDENDIADMGELMCGLEKADIEKLSKEALEAQMETLAGCMFDNETAKALVDRAKSQITDFLESSDMLAAVGGVIEHLSDSDLNAIPSDVKSDCMVAVAEKRAEKKQHWEYRKMAGYDGDRTDAEKTQTKTDEKRVMERFTDEFQTTQDARKRRRRQTDAVDCDTINSMSDPTTLTAEQLTGVDVTDCIGYLGSFEDWESDQLTQLVANAKTLYGDVNTWASGEIQEVGNLAVGLSTSEIGQLDMSNSDAVAAISASDDYSDAQLDAAYEKYKTDMSLDDNTLTADDITNLAEFTCGADNAEIESFTVYGDAASTIGVLESCETSQWESFATLAKAEYGSTPSSWTTTEVSSAGNVLGGLTSNELGSLSSDQISAISTNTIQNIPAAKFAGFSSSQLMGFTEAQANSVTADQQSSLSDSQMESLVTAGAEYKISVTDDSGDDSDSDGDDGGDSGAGTVYVSVLAFAMTLLIHW